MLSKVVSGLIIAILLAPSANASLITFSNTTVLPGGDGTQLGHATSVDGHKLFFSHNLYPQHPDGWYRVGGSVSNWFGEHNEYFEFENEVTLNSFNITSRYFDTLSSMTIRYYDDALSLIGSNTISSPTNGNWHTVSPILNGVFRMEFDFAGGTNTYGDGRTHQWLGVTNVDFNANAAVPEPASLALLGLGLAGIGFARARRQR
jgi:hypothetical protein